MLVLSRLRDETIVLDFSQATDEQLLSLRRTPITSKTVDIRGEKVRTGIDAPTFVSIDREELHRVKVRDRQREARRYTLADARAAHEAAIKK